MSEYIMSMYGDEIYTKASELARDMVWDMMNDMIQKKAQDMAQDIARKKIRKIKQKARHRYRKWQEKLIVSLYECFYNEKPGSSVIEITRQISDISGISRKRILHTLVKKKRVSKVYIDCHL